MRKKRRIIYGGTIAVGVIVASVALAIHLTPRLDIISSNPNPLIRHFAPTWRSIKKISDLPFIVSSVVHHTELPVYRLVLSENNLRELISVLPNYPKEPIQPSTFTKTVRGFFSTNGYESAEVRVRYRGASTHHWNALKKSWQINLPNDKPLGRYSALRLVLPEDRGWFAEALSAYRAKKLGVLSPELSYVRLEVNGRDMGVYLQMEGWEESFLEHNVRAFGPIFSNREQSRGDLLLQDSFISWENRLRAKSDDNINSELEYFLALVSNSSDKVFETYIPLVVNMDALYKWALVNILAGSTHQNNFDNQNLYLDTSTGLIEPIAFDLSFDPIGNLYDISHNRLVNRILQNDTFRARFEETVRSYVYDESNLQDDLSFYDELVRRIKPEIIADTTKLPTDITFLREIKEKRKLIEENFFAIRRMFKKTGHLALFFNDETYPLQQRSLPKSNLPEIIAPINGDVVLSSGIHIFRNDVVIPKNTRLVILPGAQLLFAPGVSLISYSPVSSLGTKSDPIRITALNKERPWGSFMVVGTHDIESVFENTEFSHGSGATINGIVSTGMLSAYHALITIRRSTFHSSFDDDAVNIKFGNGIITDSYFYDTASDAIDFDYGTGRIERTVFDPPIGKGAEIAGGDAIDISFGDKIKIIGNTVNACGDKGISIGERSQVTIRNNTISNCAIGIAIKDGSRAEITDTTLSNNNTGIALYRKEPRFEIGGQATTTNIIFNDNVKSVIQDPFSTLR